MNDQIIDMYLDYLNNFLTCSAFAEHYGLNIEAAAQIIKDGKRMHEQRVKEWDA